MELRNYFTLIGRHIVVFIVIVILSGLSAFAFTKLQPTSYTASTTVTVNKTSNLKQSQANYYLYDNYYNVQSASLFSQIVTSWFSSPSLVEEIYKKAGIEVPNISESKLAKIFIATWDQPATITISTSGADKVELDKLINAATEVVQTETNSLGSNNDSFYEISTFAPVITQDQTNLALNSVIGIVSGIILGLIVVMGIAYFKREEI